MWQKKWCVILFTWLSWSWKTTIANKLSELLEKHNVSYEHIDWDIMRQWLSSDLSFSESDRKKNIERFSVLSCYLSKHGVCVLGSFIAPYKSSRDYLKNQVNNYIEVYVNTSLSTCEKRDVKWLYKKARNKEIIWFTGIDSPYERPSNPDIVCDTVNKSEILLAKEIFQYLLDCQFIT